VNAGEFAPEFTVCTVDGVIVPPVPADGVMVNVGLAVWGFCDAETPLANDPFPS
jgi:hypothetical protein